jgi:phosphoglycerate kinase
MNTMTLRVLAPRELAGRRALVRVDYNVPLDEKGIVRDASRVEATVPTLTHLLNAGARPVLLSHLGRPKGQAVPRYSLAPVVPVLEKALGGPVVFGERTDSDEALAASCDLPPGRVLLLENTRFLPGETANDRELSSRLAQLGDLFVNDAFGSTHRAHASVVGVTEFLKPAVAGFLVERELEALEALRSARERPFVVALGGAKISDKIGLLETFLERADQIVIGGAMANTFLMAAGGSLGASLVEPDAVEMARDLLSRTHDKLRLPTDLVVARPDAADATSAQVVPAGKVPDGAAALDIGPESRRRFADTVEGSSTLFWNGPMGLFERAGFEIGTVVVARAAAEATRRGAFTVIGGGDSARAVRQAGLDAAVSHVSTGGGASLEYLAHGSLPGIEALDEA